MILSLAIIGAMHSADASSHREAPAIALDPAADLTDFYAFISPEDPTKAVFIMNVIPMENPGGGPNFYRFDDQVLYEIHIDNEGDGLEDIRFGFRFTTTYAMPDTFLYNLGDINDPANRNHTQTYVAARWDNGTLTRVFAPLTSPASVAPINVGVLSAPTGYNPEGSTPGSLTTSAIRTSTAPNGTYRLFAGPRQEGFYVDLERTFDLLNLAHTDNTNTLLGVNVHSIAIEVPLNNLTRNFQAPSVGADNNFIAAWATTSRPKTRTYTASGSTTGGANVQVARLGSPLVNEAVIPVSMKDTFNGSNPINDTQFLDYVINPLLPVYMNLLLGTPNPVAFDAGLGIGGREDLVLAFLTGIPGYTAHASMVLGGPIPGEPGKVFAPFEALRMNLAASASGFPDGRNVGDDVVDVALSAMAGLLIDGTFVPDGVSSAGLHYLNTFPFMGDPWSGDDHPAGFHDL